MADWFVNRALTNFRDAVNSAYPNRDKASDGTIGDTDHASRSSDHNPDPDGSVDAWDMDVELNGRGRPSGTDVEALKRVFQAHPSSSYWIHNDQIARRADNWRRRPYTDFNSSPSRNRHTQHVHWNTRQSHETSTAPWILEDDMDATERGWLEAVYKWTRDTNFAVTNIPNPAGEGPRIPLQTAMAAIDKQLDTLLEETTGLSPQDLAALKAAAMEGAAEGAAGAISAIDWANAIPEEIAAEVAELLRQRLEA